MMRYIRIRSTSFITEFFVIARLRAAYVAYTIILLELYIRSRLQTNDAVHRKKNREINVMEGPVGLARRLRYLRLTTLFFVKISSLSYEKGSLSPFAKTEKFSHMDTQARLPGWNLKGCALFISVPEQKFPM